MRPQIVRATWRAAGLATRTSPRTCHTFTAPNQPIVKHSSVASAQPIVYSANDFKASIDPVSKLPSEDAVPKPSQTDLNGSGDANIGAVSDTVFTPKDSDLPSDASFISNEAQGADPAFEGAPSKQQESLENFSSPSETDAADKEQSQFVPPSRQQLMSTEDPESLGKELRSLLRRNSVRSALFHFLGAMKVPEAPAVDDSVLKVMLPVLGRHGWAPAALDAVNLALDREYNLSSGFYNCALHAMARSGAHDTMQSVIQRMWTLPLESRPNATSYNYLIGSYMYRGTTDQAFDVLHEMKKHMIYPTFATYHALITGCLRSNDPRRAYSTLTAVERQRFDVGAMTIAQVLVSCAENDLVDEAVHLFPRLEEALPMYSHEVHRIAEKRNAYRMHFKERTTAEERATVRGATKLEIGAISTLLHSAFRNCRADLAVAAWSSLRKNYPNFTAPAPLWYCLIGALAGSGRYDKAFDALGMMRESGHVPRLRDLEAALIKPLSLDVSTIDEQYFRLCDKVAKLDLVDTSESSDASITESLGEVPPTTVAEKNGALDSNELENSSTSPSSEESLKDILSGKDVLLGLSLEVSSMQPKTVGIEEVNCIIAACSAAADLHRAFQTYDEVEKTFGLKKNVDTFNALLEGCIQVKHARGGVRILSEMEKLGHKLSGDTVHLAVRLFTRSGRSAECVDLIKRVRSDGGEIPLQSYLLLIRYYLRGNTMDKAVEVYQMGREEGYSDRLLKGRIDIESVRKLQAALGEDSDSSVPSGSAEGGEAEDFGDLSSEEPGEEPDEQGHAMDGKGK